MSRPSAPVAIQTEPRNPAAAAVVQFLAPADSGAGYLKLQSTGGRWVDSGAGYLLVDLAASSGYRASVAVGGSLVRLVNR